MWGKVRGRVASLVQQLLTVHQHLLHFLGDDRLAVLVQHAEACQNIGLKHRHSVEHEHQQALFIVVDPRFWIVRRGADSDILPDLFSECSEVGRVGHVRLRLKLRPRNRDARPYQAQLLG